MSLLSASCLRSSAQLVVLVTLFNILHTAAEPGPSECQRIQGPQQGSRVPGVTSFSSFSSSPGRWRLHCWPDGWKALGISSSLRVNWFTQMPDMRTQDLGNEKSYQKQSFTFIILFLVRVRLGQNCLFGSLKELFVSTLLYFVREGNEIAATDGTLPILSPFGLFVLFLVHFSV